MSEIIPLTEESWENEVLHSGLPVVVDFWAEWCTPCHMVAPIVEEISREYKGKIKTMNICTKCLKSGKVKKII